MNEKKYNLELAVLGSIITENSKINEIALTPSHFSNELNGIIFAEIQILNASKNPFDLTALAVSLEKTTGRSWVDNLTSITSSMFYTSNAEKYAKEIDKIFIKEQALEIADNLRDRINDDDSSAISGAIKSLMSLHVEKRQHTYSLKQSLAVAIENIDKAFNSDDKFVGVPTGLTELDDCLGGFRKGDLIVIGGRPRVGKTLTLLNFINHNNVSNGFISAEQGHEQMSQRLISINGRVSSQSIRFPKMIKDDEWPKITASIGKLSEKRCWIYDKPAPSIEEVFAEARRLKHNFNIEILFIDYIQRLTASASVRHEELGHIARSLKELAREIDIPVVVGAQVSREVEKRPNKRPNISDLKGAGAIEEEADQILLLYRDEVYDINSRDKGICEINIGKNRHGPDGMVKVAFIADNLRLENLETGYDGY